MQPIPHRTRKRPHQGGAVREGGRKADGEGRHRSTSRPHKVLTLQPHNHPHPNQRHHQQGRKASREQRSSRTPTSTHPKVQPNRPPVQAKQHIHNQPIPPLPIRRRARLRKQQEMQINALISRPKSNPMCQPQRRTRPPSSNRQKPRPQHPNRTPRSRRHHSQQLQLQRSHRPHRPRRPRKRRRLHIRQPREQALHRSQQRAGSSKLRNRAAQPNKPSRQSRVRPRTLRQPRRAQHNSRTPNRRRRKRRRQLRARKTPSQQLLSRVQARPPSHARHIHLLPTQQRPRKLPTRQHQPSPRHNHQRTQPTQDRQAKQSRKGPNQHHHPSHR